MSKLEQRFDIPFIARLALREKQIQQSYRPIIAVHKWFARRPGTLFRGLLLSEFADQPLEQAFYQAQQFPGRRIADPFMGGGTPLLEANRIGCDIDGFDINPMAWWIVRQEIEHLDLDAYRDAAARLRADLEQQVGEYYRTRCESCDAEVPVKYFLWVKVQDCTACGASIDLFPGYRVAKDSRHPQHVLVCPSCGELAEVDDPKAPGNCRYCGTGLLLNGPAKRGVCACPDCSSPQSYPLPDAGPPRHRLFALEYHCPHCRPTHKGRFFKAADRDDLERVGRSEAQWARQDPRFVPDDPILPGDESDRLHRWGYSHYRQLFNARQLLGLESSAALIAAQDDTRVRNALATNLSDLLRYQNMLCRYDAMSLKSLDIFSVHGFPVGLIECESNLMGITAKPGGAPVGSGGWANIITKYAKAKSYCDAPFEVRLDGKRRQRVSIDGEWIGDRLNGSGQTERIVNLHSADGAVSVLPANSLDGVFTDPPYFGNVQYAELMDFCYVWLRRLVGEGNPAFAPVSTRNPEELTVNDSMGRGLDHFTIGLARTFTNMARALKPGAPLAFTYHHNQLDAYLPLVIAILDAGLVCSASLPCPAEMGASIHINGTGSSIVDTVFVCRSTGSIPRRWLAADAQGIARLVDDDLGQLIKGGVKPTRGDTRCITYGHLTRLAIWSLRKTWDPERPIQDRLAGGRQAMLALATLEAVEACLHGTKDSREPQLEMLIAEETAAYPVDDRERIIF